MCEQTVPRFFISVGKIFLNSVPIRGIKKYGESTVVQISAVLDTV